MENKIEVKREYHSNGTIERERSMLNGDIHGIQKFYYINGNKIQSYFLIHGRVIGLFQQWKFNGERDIVRQYKNNLMHGILNIFRYEK